MFDQFLDLIHLQFIILFCLITITVLRFHPKNQKEINIKLLFPGQDLPDRKVGGVLITLKY